MGMAVFMKTVEEAQGKISGRDEITTDEAAQGGLEGGSAGAGGPFSSRSGGAGQGRGRTLAVGPLWPLTLLPSDSCPLCLRPRLQTKVQMLLSCSPVASVKDALCAVVREGTGELTVFGLL